MGLHALYGFTTVTLVLAVFGGFGTLKEKKWALIVVSKVMYFIFYVGGNGKF